jgi:hypothetical protein
MRFSKLLLCAVYYQKVSLLFIHVSLDPIFVMLRTSRAFLTWFRGLPGLRPSFQRESYGRTWGRLITAVV